MTSHRRPGLSRPLGLESLESRSLLAGNIAVSVTEGLLHIQGDAGNNSVQIRQLKQTYNGEWPGVKLEISGTNSRNQANTTINGEPGPLVLTGVKSGVDIDLGEGTNYLRIANIYNGNPDMVRPTPVALPGTVNIDGGDGIDTIVAYLKNHTQVTVNTEGANDSILVSGSTLYGLTINSDPSAPGPGSDGRDNIDIVAVKAKGPVSLTGGGKSDLLKIVGACVFDGSLSIGLAAGDILDLTAKSTQHVFPVLNGQTTITGLGTNSVSLQGNINGSCAVHLGSGNDRFSCGVTSTVILDISLGDGDDIASLGNNHLAGIHLDGGSGFDVLGRRGTDDLGETTITNFEENVTE